jgi:enterochelin esterase-like enzyme
MLKMEKVAILLCLIGCSGLAQSPGNQTGAVNAEPSRRVEIRDTEMRFLTSKYVDQTYEIDVFFPKDYHNETFRYPVLYVLDAEYNFGCVAFIAKRLIKNGDIPKALVVGIAYNTTEDDFYVKLLARG